MNETLIHNAVLVVRSFLPLLVIVCVNMILLGAFKVMICSGRDDEEHHAMGNIAKGVVGTFVLACLFTAATVTLAKV
ncbi:hypothetical protein A2856_03735 [Candidatus Uhrbacteria bacterium RIFCSPHIGHO2_01_FULL_63_20]|uniref:Uncharacterized protein n=1 Tax=Candidatus Uhrbacteria bacterium RIFCSPHIGHO2_01_FULL_63_20 TaxID=1802385 RepID=A0A1F7TME3_9BACT|nr:MAG: hypothetical protein A2856_03735 [Candidatus Uhrbacteria bacterium RIFCSPHIGHO2_01_FULL_63_20]